MPGSNARFVARGRRCFFPSPTVGRRLCFLHSHLPLRHWAAPRNRRFALAGLAKLMSDVCQFATPLLLRRIIGRLERGDGVYGGALVTAALLGVSALQAFSLRQYFAALFLTGLKLKSAIVGGTYRKLLRLSPSARLATSSGEITSLMGSDAQRIGDLVPYLHALWFAPLQVVGALVLLYSEVGAALLPVRRGCRGSNQRA